jgi:tetratricopeptide (TPR) repeat protein
MSLAVQESMTAGMRSKRRARAVAGRANAATGVRLARAQALAAGGRFDQAGPEVDAVLAGDPDCAPGWQIKGVLALLEGRAEAAVEALQRAVALQPEDAAGWTNLGIAQHQTGRVEAAASSLERATRLQPGLAKAEHNLGVLRGEQGRLEDAERHLRRALAADPAYAKAWLELGRIRLALGAMEDAQTCLRHAGPLPEAQLTLGLCLQESGAVDEALAVYRAALGRDPALYGAVVKNLTSAAKGCLWLRLRDFRRALLGETVGAGR